MSGTYPVVMGDRGRLVIPAQLRESMQLETGTPLILLETSQGVILATREQVEVIVRDGLAGTDPVGELLAERRRAASLEDQGLA